MSYSFGNRRKQGANKGQKVEQLDQLSAKLFDPSRFSKFRLENYSALDFSYLNLKSDHAKRPFWVTPNGRVFLEASSPLYEVARDFLTAICEPVSRPDFIHEYRLDKNSLFAAASMGMTADVVLNALRTLSKVPLSASVEKFVIVCTTGYGKAKLVLRRGRYYIESSYPAVLRLLSRHPTIRARRVYYLADGRRVVGTSQLQGIEKDAEHKFQVASDLQEDDASLGMRRILGSAWDTSNLAGEADSSNAQAILKRARSHNAYTKNVPSGMLADRLLGEIDEDDDPVDSMNRDSNSKSFSAMLGSNRVDGMAPVASAMDLPESDWMALDLSELKTTLDVVEQAIQSMEENRKRQIERQEAEKRRLIEQKKLEQEALEYRKTVQGSIANRDDALFGANVIETQVPIPRGRLSSAASAKPRNAKSNTAKLSKAAPELISSNYSQLKIEEDLVSDSLPSNGSLKTPPIPSSDKESVSPSDSNVPVVNVVKVVPPSSKKSDFQTSLKHDDTILVVEESEMDEEDRYLARIREKRQAAQTLNSSAAKASGSSGEFRTRSGAIFAEADAMEADIDASGLKKMEEADPDDDFRVDEALLREELEDLRDDLVYEEEVEDDAELLQIHSRSRKRGRQNQDGPRKGRGAKRGAFVDEYVDDGFVVMDTNETYSYLFESEGEEAVEGDWLGREAVEKAPKKSTLAKGGDPNASSFQSHPWEQEDKAEEDEEDLSEFQHYVSKLSETVLFTPGRVESFEIDASSVDKVRKVCLHMSTPLPLMAEYEYKLDESVPLLMDGHGPQAKPAALRDPSVLRPYQEKCLAKMFGNGRARSGIIVLPCGAGKTLVGITATITLGRSAMVLCPNTTSVNQWEEQFIRFSTLPRESIIKLTSRNKVALPPRNKGILLLTTYTMIGTGGKSLESAALLKEIATREWGLQVLDEVHQAVANKFSRALMLRCHCRLGLTATLVREDGKNRNLTHLIGPKLYEANWRDLTLAGFLANVQCTEIWCPLAPEYYREYLRAPSVTKAKVLAVMNPVKAWVMDFLIRHHESKNHKIIIFSESVFALSLYAKAYNAPLISGDTSQRDRDTYVTTFRTSDKVNKLFLSRVGDVALDVPDANVIIQISSHFGSRLQEAQRMGRILRRGTKSSAATGSHSYFYTLISTDTLEMYFGNKRRRYLVDQGYAYDVVPAAPGVSPTLEILRKNSGVMSSKEERLNVLREIVDTDVDSAERNEMSFLQQFDMDPLQDNPSVATVNKDFSQLVDKQPQQATITRRVLPSMAALSGAQNIVYHEFTSKKKGEQRIREDQQQREVDERAFRSSALSTSTSTGKAHLSNAISSQSKSIATATHTNVSPLVPEYKAGAASYASASSALVHSSVTSTPSSLPAKILFNVSSTPTPPVQASPVVPPVLPVSTASLSGTAMQRSPAIGASSVGVSPMPAQQGVAAAVSTPPARSFKLKFTTGKTT